MKILVINGPNLNMLGKRDEKYYGQLTLSKLEELISGNFPEVEFTFSQSNVEGEIINIIQNAPQKFDGVIINPGGYAHTSVAIRDALADCNLPKVEVHLSHLVNRDSFRQNLITASCCDGYITGFKEKSYIGGIFILLQLIADKENNT